MRILSSTATTTWLLTLVAWAACTPQPVPTDSVPSSTGGIGGSFAADGGVGGKGAGGSINVGKGGKGGSGFVDTRPVVTPEHAPPPISGGTLLALRAGGRAVVADTDRDRIVFVDTQNRWVEATVALGEGAEPGRLVEGEGAVHVLLRGTGEVVTLDSTTHEIVSRRAVCKAPRGLYFDEAEGTLLVACLEGRLVELPATDGEPIRNVASDVDLRDVLVAGDRLVATRFRSAEVLELDADLATVSRSVLGSNGNFTPSVAWRAVPGPDGSVVVVHQRGTTESIMIGDDVDPAAAGAPGVDEGFTQGGTGGSTAGGYGSGDPCSGIVETAVTIFAADGTVTTSGRLAGSVLPVDIAVSPGGLVAVASAGIVDPEGAIVFSESMSLGVYGAEFLDKTFGGQCLFPDILSDFGAPAVGVAFDPVSEELFVQTREPASLTIWDLNTQIGAYVPLGGLSALETGHEIFHRDSGAGLACASCHPEGTDDGRVWEFSTTGMRRTQPLDTKLADSQPFHWNGEFETLGGLMNEVFVARMSGLEQEAQRVDALANFLFGLRPRPAVRASTDAAALRGKAIFESENVGCTECHQGSSFRTNETVDIGKGEPTQVPSLLGVSSRPPYMHDGCAATLSDRFGTTCGGSKHGKLADLDDDAMNDLIAYLETL